MIWRASTSSRGSRQDNGRSQRRGERRDDDELTHHFHMLELAQNGPIRLAVENIHAQPHPPAAPPSSDDDMRCPPAQLPLIIPPSQGSNHASPHGTAEKHLPPLLRRPLVRLSPSSPTNKQHNTSPQDQTSSTNTPKTTPHLRNTTHPTAHHGQHRPSPEHCPEHRRQGDQGLLQLLVRPPCHPLPPTQHQN